MLALSRKVDESIIIGNDIEIKILEVKGEQVRIGISAPKTVPIYRKELYAQIESAKKESISNIENVHKLKELF